MCFSLFCRKSGQSWMRRFWAKKCRRDHLRSWWRSVGGSIEKLLKEDGEVWLGVGLRSLWRSVASMTVRPACSSWSSVKWSQYPDFKSWSVLERRPLMDRCAYDGPSYFPSRVIKKRSWRNCISMGRRSPWRSVVTTMIRARSVDPAAFWQISSK